MKDLRTGLKEWFYSTDAIRKRFGLTQLAGFNSGVIYFQKGKESKTVFDDAFHFAEHYRELKIRPLPGGIPDEQLLSLSMGIHGIKPINDKEKIMMYSVLGMTELKLDVLRQICTYKKNDVRVQPAIFHGAGGYPKAIRWQLEVVRLNIGYFFIRLLKQNTGIKKW